MGSRASKEHDEALKTLQETLEQKGYRVILLAEKSPDGIAVKGDRICAIEVLGKRIRKIGNRASGRPIFKAKYDGGITKALKRRNYRMFDNVIFGEYILKDERVQEEATK